MRPILLKGHTRALTHVKYNQDGDLLFTCSKDNRPTLWYSDNGERVGTYEGHNGTVWGCDVTFDSTVDADAFTQVAGAGTTLFSGLIDLAGDFEFTGENLTISGQPAAPVLNEVGGLMRVTNAGTFTLSFALRRAAPIAPTPCTRLLLSDTMMMK